MYKTVGLALLVASISGCSQSHVLPDPPAPRANDISALDEFERLSVEMIHEMRLWAKAKEAANRDVLSDRQIQQRFYQSTHIPEGFDKKVTFNFYGDAKKAMEAIAISAGYEFTVKNSSAKQSDPVVDIKLQNQRLVEALYEVGLATGDSVTIEVLEGSASNEEKKIIYRYK